MIGSAGETVEGPGVARSSNTGGFDCENAARALAFGVYRVEGLCP